jgi:hypothetical protein
MDIISYYVSTETFTAADAEHVVLSLTTMMIAGTSPFLHEKATKGKVDDGCVNITNEWQLNHVGQHLKMLEKFPPPHRQPVAAAGGGNSSATSV